MKNILLISAMVLALVALTHARVADAVIPYPYYFAEEDDPNYNKVYMGTIEDLDILKHNGIVEPVYAYPGLFGANSIPFQLTIDEAELNKFRPSAEVSFSVRMKDCNAFTRVCQIEAYDLQHPELFYAPHLTNL